MVKSIDIFSLSFFLLSLFCSSILPSSETNLTFHMGEPQELQLEKLGKSIKFSAPTVKNMCYGIISLTTSRPNSYCLVFSYSYIIFCYHFHLNYFVLPWLYAKKSFCMSKCYVICIMYVYVIVLFRWLQESKLLIRHKPT